MAMKLSTGKVAFPIEFDNGDKDVIYFNPADPDLMRRFHDFENNLAKKMNEMKDFELNEEGQPKEAVYVKEYQLMLDVFCKELDYALGGEISKVVFKYCSPLAIVNGEFFVVQFIRAILPEIEKHVKKAIDTKNKKCDKYLKKYEK